MKRLKRTGIVLFLVVAVGLLLGGMSSALADDVTERTDVKVTNFTISHKDTNDTSGTFRYNETFNLNMDWDASSYGNSLKSGDYFIVTLPDKFRFPTNSAATKFDLTDASGNVVGKAVVSPGENGGGTIKVTFTDYVENRYDIKGKMQLEASFTKVTYDESNTFQVSIGSNVQTITVPISGPVGLKDEVIGKWGQAVKGQDDQAQWYVRINHTKGQYDNFVYNDALSVKNGDLGGMHYIEDSFVLREVKMNEYGVVTDVVQTVDLTNKLQITDNGTKFTLNLGNLNGKQYHLAYKTTYVPGSTLHNQAGAQYTGGTKTTTSGFRDASSSGSGEGSLMSKIQIRKVDSENNQTVLAGAIFKITNAKGESFELTTGADGTATSGKLTPGTYKIVEVTPPAGYQLNAEEYTVAVTSDEATIKTITDKKATTNICGTKTWDDANNQDGKRPDSVTVNLLADGKEVAEKKVTAADQWRYSFADLPEYNEAGQKINYTVTEDAVADYSASINGYDIKNSYTPKKTSVTVTKRWNDAGNQDGIRPGSVKVQLYADGQKSGGEVELNSGNNWTATWSNLPEKAAGKTIAYTVKEVGSVSGYTTTTGKDSSNGSIIICNKHTPEKTAVSGKKTWDDANNQDGKRPDRITVNLLANGTKVAEKTVTADNNWAYQFDGLPKYQNGQKITYTVTENAVADYNASIDGYNIKNSYTPKKTSVTVTKSWNDANDQDGLRPDSVNVQLYADGQKSGDAVELNSGNKWTATWNDLPEKAAGKTIAYTVKEVGSVSGYTTAVDDRNVGDIRITNSHTPSVTSVSGTKTWNDAGDQDGKRPESVTVNLLADGKEVAEKKVTAGDHWQYRFTNLPEYNAGKKIVYTVTEDAVKDYSTSVAGYDLVNSYTPKKTSVTVTKHWNDSNNRDKLRPARIRVQLYANGEKAGDAVTLSAENKWTKTWANLAQKKDGKPIRYTVKETGVGAGYTATVSDQDPGNIIITNSHTPKAIAPQTRDQSRAALYLSGVIASAAGLLALAMKRRVIQ
jgi:serine-aspartate repeat-containing protein C/D/E